MIGILTQNPKDWSNKRLQIALREKGFDYVCLKITDFIAKVSEKPFVLIENYDLSDFEAIFVRGIPGGSLEQIIFRIDVLHRLENLGVRVINSASCIEKTVDKYYALTILEDKGIPVPKTYCCESRDTATQIFEELQDVVLKPLFGSQGAGVLRVNNEDIAYTAFKTFELTKNIFYLQEYLPHKNEDIRIFVLKDRVVSSMKRISETWKTNISRGGIAKKYNPSKAEIEIAVKASRVLGCQYCGVDILESMGKFYVIEVNSIPAWFGLQKVTDFDIGEKIVEELLI